MYRVSKDTESFVLMSGTVSSRLVNIHLSSSDFSVNETLISHEAVMVLQPRPCSADAHVGAL